MKFWCRARRRSAVVILALLTFTISATGVAHAAARHGLPSISDPRLTLSGAQWAKDQTGPTMDQMFPPHGFAMQHPLLVWLLMLELLGVLGFPLVFGVLNRLRDRGWIAAKTLGLLIPAYLVWISTEAGISTFDRTSIWLSVGLLTLLSAVLYVRRWREMRAWLYANWRSVVTAEAVFLALFAFFVLLRMWYPDLGHQFSPVANTNWGEGRMGEKQMEMAFLSAIVRSRVFPPYDPFFAGGYINYYYYGFLLVGLLCKALQVAPATGFNLAIATFAALLGGTLFSAGSTLTRRIGPGLIAALFGVLIGNLAGAWQVINDLMGVATIHSGIPILGGIEDVVSGLQAVLFNHQQLPAFDFWSPTRVIPPVGIVINEFPYFTYLFADLHPHLIAYPITAAVLLLAINFALEQRVRFTQLAAAGLLLGTLIATNPWDVPTYAGVLALGALVGAFAASRRLQWRLAAPGALALFAPVLVGYLLFLPFQRQYHTVFRTGLGLTRNITGQGSDAVLTPLGPYLEHFGFFVFLLVSWLAVLFWRGGGSVATGRARRAVQFLLYYRDHFGRAWAAQRAVRRMIGVRPGWLEPVLLGSLILVAGLALLQYYLLAFLFALMAFALILLIRSGRSLPAEQIFVLCLLLVPLAISAGTQVFYVRDFLDGGNAFRMNTIFKFYNQAWTLFSVTGAAALYYFMRTETEPGIGKAVVEEEVARPVTMRAIPEGGPPIQTYATFAMQPAAITQRSSGGLLARPLALADRRPIWSLIFVLLLIGSLIYTYAGTVSRETYRESWLPESSIPFTLDGMAFMKVAYPQDYAGIQWLNSHVHGAQVIAEAGNTFYDWRSRVTMFTGLPDILNGIHEGEQRYNTGTRQQDLETLYNSADPAEKMQILHEYEVRYIFVGFSEQQCSQYQCYSRTGLATFHRMLGHGLRVAFHRPGVTIYEVTA